MNSPAPITFFCVHCGTKLLVPVELAGETGPCPQCAAVITAPLVSSNRPSLAVPTEIPAAAPVLPPARLEPTRARHHELQLPPLEMPPVEQVPLDYGRPAGGVAGYGGGFPEVAPVTRGVASSRRSVSVEREDLPVSLGSSRFDEPTPPRSFPVALVSLLLVVLSGAGYLSWRMGFWGPAESGFASEVTERPSQIAKTAPIPVVTASVSPVASRGAVPNGLESPAAPAVAEPVSNLTLTPPPGPQPLASLTSAQSQGAAEVSPPISEPRLAVVPPEPVKPAVAAGQASASRGLAAPASQVTAESTPLERARNVVRLFLEANSWKDRVGLIEVEGDPAAVLSAYYQRNPDLAVKNYRLDFFHTEESQAGGASAHIFFLTFANEADGFPVMILERNGEYRMDWNLYVEFRERAFQRFVEEMPAEAMRFRVVLQRVTYGESDREEIPGVDQLLCYKIDPPYPGMTRYAFIDKEKPIGKQMARELSWEADPLAAEVQLKWAEFPGGKRYLTIEQLVSSSWVRSSTAKLAQP